MLVFRYKYRTQATDRPKRETKTGDGKMTIQKQLEQLATIMQARETIPASAAEKFLDLLDKAPKEALEMLVSRKVKFLWMPAKRRLVEKFGAI